MYRDCISLYLSIFFVVVASSVYRSQRKESALEPKVGGIQFRLHVLKEGENHLEVCIEYTEGSPLQGS